MNLTSSTLCLLALIIVSAKFKSRGERGPAFQMIRCPPKRLPVQAVGIVEGLRCGAVRCHNVPGGRSTEAAFWFESDAPQVCMARRTARNSARQQEKDMTQAACVQGHRVVNRVFPICCYHLALCLCLDQRFASTDSKDES